MDGYLIIGQVVEDVHGNFADKDIFLRYNLIIERKRNLYFYGTHNRKGGISVINHTNKLYCLQNLPVA